MGTTTQFPAGHTHESASGSKVSGFLKEPLAREIVAGITGPRLNRTFLGALKWFPDINRAHLIMLAEQGLIDQNAARNLLTQIDTLEEEGAAAFTLDPEREDPWFNYESELTKRAGADAGRLHLGRSRNDMKTTQDRLEARELALELIRQCLNLREALLVKASAEIDCTMPGYTHLQHAQPMTFGWYLVGLACALSRDTQRIWDALVRMDECPLGAGAFAGTRVPINRNRTAELLGFSRPQPHSLDAVANPDAIVELTCASTQLSLSIGRMCQDFYLWSTFEFGMLEFPDRVASTSSIMPQKKNLTVLENFKARPAVVLGALTTAVSSLRGTPFGHSQEVSVETNRWVWDALRELATMMPVATVLVRAVASRQERMLALASANFATATGLADLLTLRLNIPFRETHHIVGRYVRYVMEGKTPTEALGLSSLEELGHVPDGIEGLLSEIVDPAYGLQQLCVGPSRVETELLIEEQTEILSSEKLRLDAYQRRLAASADRLNNASRDLVTGPEAVE